MTGWRGLGVFWLAVLLLLGTTAGILQTLGPPSHRAVQAVREAPASPAAAAPAPPRAPLVSERREVPNPQRPGRDTPGPVVDPDPALLEAGPDGGRLPQIAADGRMPMQVYAAGFDRSSRRPRIGLVLGGIGLDTAASTAAIRTLPPGITLAISPYAASPQKTLEAARFAEHEYLLALPMEPEGFPLNDPGPRALMTNLSPAENLDRLNWLLSRIAGYAGVTGALGVLRGERFAAATDQMSPLLARIAQRGLLYIDPRLGQAPLPRVWSRDVDVVVDEPVAEIDGKLTELERIARNTGSALGLAGTPRPVTVQRIATWANSLADRGFVLAPTSALVVPPPDAKPAQ